MPEVMVLEVITAFKDEILKFAKTQVDEINQALDKGLNEYTFNWKRKIDDVKTFLSYENPVSFEQIYIPLSLKFLNKVVVIPENIENLFKASNCITILGHAGSGKTMIMKHCFLQCLKMGKYIPIIIELRKIDSTSMSLSEYISSIVFQLNLAKNEAIYNRLMMQGEFVFFLDGYDEISITNKKKRTAEIEELIDRYPKNYFLLTSRPGADAETMPRFRSYHVCDLSNEQIKEFVRLQVGLMEEEGSIIADKIIKTIESSKISSIVEYFRNPLLLSMFILTYRYNPELPSKKSDFYYNVFETLYCKHDTRSKSGGYIHERKCKLEKEQYLQILRNFSFISYFDGRYEFESSYLNKKLSEIKEEIGIEFDNDDMIYDLRVSISIFLLDGNYYSFPHRSMQEYFASDMIRTLDTDIKKDYIYKQLMSKKYSFDGYNFWTLCEEMDNVCFLTHFVLRYLREFEKQMSIQIQDMDEEECVFLNYLNNQDIKLNYDDGTLSSVSHSPNLYHSLVRFLDRKHNMMMCFFDWNNRFPNESKQFLDYPIGYDGEISIDTKNKDIQNRLLATSLPSIICESYHHLQEKMKEIEDGLEAKKRQEKNLIKLIRKRTPII